MSRRPNSSLNRKIALVCIILSAILIADNFILKPISIEESFAGSEESKSYRRKVGTTFKYYIVSERGNFYKVPFDIYLYFRSSRASFTIYKTAIFKQVLKIEYKRWGQPVTTNIGNVNSGKVGIIVIIYAVIISLLNIFPFLIIPHETRNQQFLFIGALALLAMIIIYFWRG